MVSETIAARPLESAVIAALHDVHDPEIPAISVVDLGVVGRVRTAPGSVRVELLPTFIGCPAVEMIRADVERRLSGFADDVAVEVSYAEPWTSARITPAGRLALRHSGFAPPSDELVECPYCGSQEVRLENAFGPTLCRAIYYCADCRQPFEQFKAV
jgi:ring-1,2-phenylacetyl-CoA epoxidase subunit PaaD